MRFSNKHRPFFFVPAALILVWWLLTALRWVDPIILPTPADVIASLPKMFVREHLAADIFGTLGRVSMAILIAGIFGIPLGLLSAHYGHIYAYFEDALHALRSIPASALFPLLLIVIGVGERSLVALASYPALLVILVSTVTGARLANKRRLYHAKILGLSAPALLFEVLFYEALPHIFSGIRVAISYALVLIVAVEMFIGVGDIGLGRRIYDYQTAYRIPETYAAILITGFIGIGLNAGLAILERHTLRWLPNVDQES